MTVTTTEGIRVSVKAEPWPERSNPDTGQYAFTYQVEISNTGELAAQLMSRHWLITDGSGHQEEVRGEGVVGKQPRLEPGQRFSYTSWAMLRAPFGSMRGSYFLVRPDGTKFEAKIGEFVLALPNALH